MDASTYEAILNREYRNKLRKARRVRQLRRRCILFALALVLTFVLAISYHAILSEATSSDKEVSYKYYTSIEVPYGASLWSIAEEYAGEEYASAKEYVHEVMEINHLREENITAGQYLVVPYYSTELK